jgi:hypothetical protein
MIGRQEARRAAITAEDVLDFLHRHPRAFRGSAELMALAMPERVFEADHVEDLQSHLIGRLRTELKETRAREAALLERSETRRADYTRAQEAVLLFFDAQSFEDLIETVTGKLVECLELTAVSLCVESNDTNLLAACSSMGHMGVELLPPGTVDFQLGDEFIRIRSDIHGSPLLFGPMARRVRSEAVLRLDFGVGAPAAVLALGAADPQRFGPKSCFEPLLFLAQALERAVHQWLELPEE